MNPGRVFSGHLFALLFTLTLVLFVPRAWAHSIGESYVFLEFHDDRTEGRVEISLDDFNVLKHSLLEDHQNKNRGYECANLLLRLLSSLPYSRN